MNPQALSARLLHHILDQHQTAARGLDALAKEYDLSPGRFGLVKQIGWGVLRDLPLLQAIASRLFKKAPAQDELTYLLLAGLYQLRDMSMPDSVTVNETVNATTLLGHPWAKGLMNACLRRYQREHTKILATIKMTEEVRYGHPVWLIALLKRAWPEHWEAILAEGKVNAPTCLRIAKRGGSRASYLKKLQAENIPAHPIAWAPDAVMLEGAASIRKLPGYDTGEFVVQDAGAQLAVPLLNFKPGMRVLDACCAPGGKLMHALDTESKLQMVAVDQAQLRMKTLEHNLKRMKIGDAVSCYTDDLLRPRGRWAKQAYSRILLDAPCSALGIARRHPDVRWLRQKKEIAGLAATQLALLKSCWRMLAPGGQILYVTCSILPAENSDVIKAFLAETSNAKVLPIEADWGVACEFGRQLLPSSENDGFYFCLIEK